MPASLFGLLGYVDDEKVVREHLVVEAMPAPGFDQLLSICAAQLKSNHPALPSRPSLPG